MSWWHAAQARLPTAPSCAHAATANRTASSTRMCSIIIPTMAPGKIRIAAGACALALLAAAQTKLFEEVELDFVQQPSKTASKFLLESVSGGVALLDYDGDGLLDIYMVNGAALRDGMSKGAQPDKRDPKYWNRLYRN